MNPLRTAARAMLASMFVYGGIDAIRNPGPKIQNADEVVQPVSDAVEQVPDDTEKLIRANGALQVGAGIALATGIMRRPAALALAASLIPTTAAGHRFWEADAEASKAQQTIHFMKNVSMLGGLLIAAMDTEGEPGAAWRARYATERAQVLADHKQETAALKAELARERTRAASAETRAKISAGGREAVRDAKVLVKAGRTAARAAGSAGRGVKQAVSTALPF